MSRRLASMMPGRTDEVPGRRSRRSGRPDGTSAALPRRGQHYDERADGITFAKSATALRRLQFAKSDLIDRAARSANAGRSLRLKRACMLLSTPSAHEKRARNEYTYCIAFRGCCPGARGGARRFPVSLGPSFGRHAFAGGADRHRHEHGTVAGPSTRPSSHRFDQSSRFDDRRHSHRGGARGYCLEGTSELASRPQSQLDANRHVPYSGNQGG